MSIHPFIQFLYSRDHNENRYSHYRKHMTAPHILKDDTVKQPHTGYVIKKRISMSDKCLHSQVYFVIIHGSKNIQ